MQHICAACGTSFEGRPYRRYCNSGCAAAPRRAGDADIAAWLAGEIDGHTGATLKLKPWVREWVLHDAGHACSECGWDRRHPGDGRCLVEVGHRDGDAANSRPENLRALCPNCPACTLTFRRRNAKSARRRSIVTVVLSEGRP